MTSIISIGIFCTQCWLYANASCQQSNWLSGNIMHLMPTFMCAVFSQWWFGGRKVSSLKEYHTPTILLSPVCRIQPKAALTLTQVWVCVRVKSYKWSLYEWSVQSLVQAQTLVIQLTLDFWRKLWNNFNVLQKFTPLLLVTVYEDYDIKTVSYHYYVLYK